MLSERRLKEMERMIQDDQAKWGPSCMSPTPAQWQLELVNAVKKLSDVVHHIGAEIPQCAKCWESFDSETPSCFLTEHYGEMCDEVLKEIFEDVK